MSAALHFEYRTFSSCWPTVGRSATTKKKKISLPKKKTRFFYRRKHESAHRLPRSTVLEDVQDVEERGGSDELLGRPERRDTISVLVIRGRENSQGEVLHVRGRRAVDGDGIGWANCRTDVFERGKEG